MQIRIWTMTLITGLVMIVMRWFSPAGELVLLVGALALAIAIDEALHITVDSEVSHPVPDLVMSESAEPRRSDAA